jgi:hypothetical protein
MSRFSRRQAQAFSLIIGSVFVVLTVGLGLYVETRKRSAQAESDDELAARYFPGDLAQKANEVARAGGATRRSWSVAATSFAGGGSSDLVVAYTNSYGGAVRVLRRSGSQVTVAEAPRFPSMGGPECAVELIDIDGDGVMEVLAMFSGAAGGTRSWIFRWTGSGLAVIGPSTTDGAQPSSALGEPTFRDLDGDHVLEAIDSSLDEAGHMAYSIFKLVGESFVLWKQPAFYGQFARDGQRFTLAKERFQGGLGTHRLFVVNGNGDTGRVRSGVIRVNGNIVVRPCQFGKETAFIDVPVSLTGNTDDLEVEIRGSAAGEIALMIE